MCRRAFARLLGVGEHRLGRTRHCFQGRDERQQGQPRGGRPNLQEQTVHAFLRNLYWSVAETMPTGAATVSMIPHDQDSRQQLLEDLAQNALEGSGQRAFRHPSELPRRELPPGNWSDIYCLYLAHCLAVKQEAVSRATFYRASALWYSCLRLRAKSQHSTCLECDQLRSKMRHAKDFMSHALAADLLLGHLSLAWQAKRQYWSARAQSRLRNGTLLTLIVDGFDKSKLLLPRWARGRTPKGTVFDKNRRPNLNLACVLAHGFGAFIYIADEAMSCGASWTWEILFRTTEMVWQKCRMTGERMPGGLWVQGDNTVKELKNSVTGRLCSMMQSLNFWDDCGHHHLPVGHTHEDIDGLFGVVSLAITQAGDDVQTPQDAARLIEQKMSPMFASRGEEVKVQLVHRVRPWKEALPNFVRLQQVYKERRASDRGNFMVPHSFLFCQRAALPQALLVNATERLPGGVWQPLPT